jgi:hypothetical protein
MQRMARAGRWGASPARMIIVGGVCDLAWAVADSATAGLSKET